jgi:hypothetical protein
MADKEKNVLVRKFSNALSSAAEKVQALFIEPAAEIDAAGITQDSETDTYQFQDRAAVALVLEDIERDENFVNVLQWAAGWTLADTLYQSPTMASAFDGGNVAQANVPKYTLSNVVSSIVPKLMEGLFYEDPPFLLRPFPGTDQQVIRAKTALFSEQLWEMKFKEETERSLEQMCLLGTCIMKWGFSSYTKKIKKYKRKAAPTTIDVPGGKPKVVHTPLSDAFEIVYDEQEYARPWIKYCDIRTVFVDSGCRYGDIRRAGHVSYRDYATYQDLDHYRDLDGYDIPDESTLKALFMRANESTPGADNISMTIPENMRGYIQHAVPRNYKTTSDPMKAPIEMIERWDAERIIVILSCNGHNILIRNEPNPYGKIPFLSANWRNIPDSFYGQGLGLLVGSEQLVEQGVTNLALDLLAYGLQPTAVRKKGFNTPTQNTRWGLGRIVDVDDDVDKSFKFMTMPPVPGEAWQFIQQAKSDSATTAGSNELVGQGSTLSGARTSGMRSGTGAAAVVQANASRLDGPMNRFIEQIFIPWLYTLDELNNDLLPSTVLRQVLGEKMEEDFEVDHELFRNAKIEYEVLAGAHLGAKRSMAQAIPEYLQLINNPTYTANINDAGYIWDGIAVLDGLNELSGWRFGRPFVRKMTSEEKQKHDANTPAALQQQQLQAQQQNQLLQFQQEEKLEDQRQLGKAGAEVLRQTTEHALTEPETEGLPSSTGFGDITAL